MSDAFTVSVLNFRRIGGPDPNAPYKLYDDQKLIGTYETRRSAPKRDGGNSNSKEKPDQTRLRSSSRINLDALFCDQAAMTASGNRSFHRDYAEVGPTANTDDWTLVVCPECEIVTRRQTFAV
jgi:hypothetical protein